MSKKNNNQPVKKEEKKFYEKLPLSKSEKLYYFILPLIFAVIALACSILDFEMQATERPNSDKMEYNTYVGVTEIFHSDRYIENVSIDDLNNIKDNDSEVHKASTKAEDGFIGDPNVIAIVGCVCLILCFFIIPKSMLKIREHGDGLGLMFLPLGLMCINNILCSFIYTKDIVIAILFSVACFVVSALATFKSTIKYVSVLCWTLLLVALFLIIAKLGPYCYNENNLQKVVDNKLVYISQYQFYISYFVRDVFMLASFGIFSSYIAKIYKFNEK